jgi:hypothetical protein
LLPLAATQTTLPSADVRTRPGLQPAATVATTARAGSISAAATLTTCSEPYGIPALAASLVTYSQRPSGENPIPTGSRSVGMAPR